MSVGIAAGIAKTLHTGLLVAAFGFVTLIVRVIMDQLFDFSFNYLVVIPLETHQKARLVADDTCISYFGPNGLRVAFRLPMTEIFYHEDK